MNYNRIDLRRTKRGPIVAVLFGVVITGRTLTAEVCFVPALVKRSVRVYFETFQMQTVKNLVPDFYGPIFGSEVPQFEVLNG